MLLEWRTQQALEYENKTKQYTKEEIFEHDQMVYLLGPHSSAVQTNGTYHVNQIKKGSVCTLQGIVNTFDGYIKALKNTLLNKFGIETPDNKIQEVTLEDGPKRA